MAYRESIYRATLAAFRSHNFITGLSNDEPTEVQVWHLILSLLEFCDQEGIDFDLQLEDARLHIATDA